MLSYVILSLVVEKQLEDERCYVYAKRSHSMVETVKRIQKEYTYSYYDTTRRWRNYLIRNI